MSNSNAVSLPSSVKPTYNNKGAMTCVFQQCGMCDEQNLRSACAYRQSDQSLYLSFKYSMRVKLLTEHHLDFLSLKGGCKGLSESILVKMTHCLKSHVAAQMECLVILHDFLFSDDFF